MKQSYLLSELTAGTELVFIPVNKANWHWDTLGGANYSYTEPLVTELSKHLRQEEHPNLAEYLVKKHNIRQSNGYDCGIAVIAIIKRIREKYSGDMRSVKLGEIDFGKERQELRDKYLAEQK